MSSAVDSNQRDIVHSLYSEHHGWLQSWLRKKLSCPHNAADMAQDTFFRLLSVPLADLISLQTPRAFLTTTATRLIIDDARRHKVEQAYLEALAASQQGMHYSSPEQHLQTVETLTMIVRMLEGLPSKPREAFLLSRLDMLTYQEIAVRLGVSSSMIKQYIAQAMVHCHAVAYGKFV